MQFAKLTDFVFFTASEDAKKITQEFQEYQRKLEQQKQDYRKEHPDQVLIM